MSTSSRREGLDLGSSTASALCTSPPAPLQGKGPRQSQVPKGLLVLCFVMELSRGEDCPRGRTYTANKEKKAGGRQMIRKGR